jgi:hypothetical protein
MVLLTGADGIGWRRCRHARATTIHAKKYRSTAAFSVQTGFLTQAADVPLLVFDQTVVAASVAQKLLQILCCQRN